MDGSIVDLVKEHMGKHPKTYIHPILDKSKKTEYENLNLNICLDFILEKLDPKNPEGRRNKKIRVVKDSAEL